jgi:ABC-type Na+ efflux pump permease subunit
MRMSHVRALILSELKRVWNDKAIVTEIIVVPIAMGILFGFIAYRSPTTMDTTVFVDNALHVPVNTQVQKLIYDIDNYRRADGSKPFSVTVELNSQADAMKRLEEGKTRAVIIIKQGEDGIESIDVVADVAAGLIYVEYQQILPQIFSSYAKEISIKTLSEYLTERNGVPASTATQEATQIMNPVETTFRTDAWKDLKYFDFYAAAYMLLLAIALPFNISVVSLSTERSTGTIERIFVSPFSRSEIITGKLAAYSILVLIYGILMMVTLKAVFDVALVNIGLTLLIITLCGINGVILGLMISTVTRTEAESVVVGTMVFLALAAMMTYMVPRETMHPIAKFLSEITPFPYGFDSIRRVNMVGLGLSDVWHNLVILGGFIIAQTLIAIPILRRQVT